MGPCKRTRDNITDNKCIFMYYMVLEAKWVWFVTTGTIWHFRCVKAAVRFGRLLCVLVETILYLDYWLLYYYLLCYSVIYVYCLQLYSFVVLHTHFCYLWTVHAMIFRNPNDHPLEIIIITSLWMKLRCWILLKSSIINISMQIFHHYKVLY